MYIKRFVKHYYIMLIPALLWLFFFSIVPMFGIVMAFQDYNPGQGILHSKFVGLANFEYMFQMSDITQVLRNTVVIAVGKIIGNIIIPLVFALLLNELAVKKFLQEKIRFLDIYEIIRQSMDRHKVIQNPNLDEILAAEDETYKWIESRW